MLHDTVIDEDDFTAADPGWCLVRQTSTGLYLVLSTFGLTGTLWRRHYLRFGHRLRDCGPWYPSRGISRDKNGLTENRNLEKFLVVKFTDVNPNPDFMGTGLDK